MSKYDLNVMLYKLLAYLNECLTRSKKPKMSVLRCNTSMFPVDEYCFNVLLQEAYAKGLITNINIIETDGGEPIVRFDSHIRITLDGVNCLEDNSKMRKIAKFCPGIISVIIDLTGV